MPSKNSQRPTEVKPARYSAAELKVLKVLHDSKKPLSTLELSVRYYGRKAEQPYNGRQVVGALLRSLKAKADYNRELWRVSSSPRKGPHAITWWVR